MHPIGRDAAEQQYSSSNQRRWVSLAHCVAYSITQSPALRRRSLRRARRRRFRTLLQLRLNRALQTLRLRRASPPLHTLSILRDKELLEVPLNPLQAHDAGFAVLHPLPHGLDLRPVDVCFAEYREGDAVVELAEGLDVFVAAWVLGAELVAGKAEDFEVRVGGLEFCGCMC